VKKNKVPINSQCVVPENIYTSTIEGIIIFENLGLTELPSPTPRKFQCLLWREYGNFLELHN